jgi:hypothetical protein
LDRQKAQKSATKDVFSATGKGMEKTVDRGTIELMTHSLPRTKQ